MLSTRTRVLVLAFVCALAVPFAPQAMRAGASFNGSSDGSSDVISADRLRIRSHLAAVEEGLRATDVSHLTAEQRARRAAALDDLREYRRAERFPHNHTHTTVTPLFRDEHGTLCAMAYLIERSGHGALVDRVAATANDAYIRELAADPELISWLEHHGLTTAEAALVQPMYGPAPEPDDESVSDLTRHYGAIGGALIVADAVAIYLTAPNRPDVGTARALFGLGAGAVSAGTALFVLDDGADRGTRRMAAANMAFGALAAGLGIFHLASGSDGVLGMGLLPGDASLTVRPALLSSEARPGLVFDLRY